MKMTYNGYTASPRDLPGSSPQGAFLGIFLFIVKYNGVALRPSIPRIAFHCSSKLANCKDQNCQFHPKSTHTIYVDDLAEAEAINLKTQLVPGTQNRPYPLKYHERTGQRFPQSNSLLQKNLHRVEEFSNKNLLKINESKSKILFFNPSTKFDFPPEFSFSSGDSLEVLQSCRIVGIIISHDLKWEQNTQSIYTKAMKKNVAFKKAQRN